MNDDAGLEKALDGAVADVVESGSREHVITGLAGLSPDVLLDEKALAGALGVCGRTLRRMVSRHELPPAVKLAGRSRWFAGRVLDHIKARADLALKSAERELSRIQRIGGT